VKRLLNLRVASALALGLFASIQSSAYSPYGWKWNTLSVDYYVNPANLDITPEAAIAAVRAGADGWALQSGSPFAFNYVGTTTGTTVVNNGKNEVFFRNATNGTAIATTYYWSSGGQALDTDIVFWDGAYKFFTGSSGCSGGFYVEDVATHEFGHALGLGHSAVADATMVSGQQYCGTYKRSLALDDILGLEVLYPLSSTNLPPTVAIVTPLANSTFTVGTTISFTGTAVDTEDGVLTSSLQWNSNLSGALGTGGAIARALVAGTHTITASATDSKNATRVATISVTVSDPNALPSGVTLQARAYKIKSAPRVELTWSANAWTSVDVYRNGVKILNTANDRTHTDAPPKGTATYSYQICQVGTTTCSNSVSVTF
jgi:hypothetical protein